MSSEQTNNDPWSQSTVSEQSTQPSSDPWGQATDTSPSADWLSSETVETIPLTHLTHLPKQYCLSILGLNLV